MTSERGGSAPVTPKCPACGAAMRFTRTGTPTIYCAVHGIRKPQGWTNEMWRMTATFPQS